MPIKKKAKKSDIEKAEEIVEESLEEAEGIVGDIVENVEESLSDNDSKPAKKKTAKTTAKKKTSKKKEEKPEEDKKVKLAELLKKAKKLEEGVEEKKEFDIKKKLKSEEEKKDTLVPMEDYLKASIHLGTRVITPDMRPYVYRRRADGLAVFNTSLLDDKIREGADYLAQYAPEDVIVICKREAGWKALKKFSEATGIRAFTKKYPAGILTNPNLDDFIETELVFICDPWLDKNAFNDAKNVKIPVLSVCDTNNYTRKVDKVIPGNNKSAKSLGIIFYLLAKLYIEKRGLDRELPPISEFIENWETLEPPK